MLNPPHPESKILSSPATLPQSSGLPRGALLTRGIIAPLPDRIPPTREEYKKYQTTPWEM